MPGFSQQKNDTEAMEVHLPVLSVSLHGDTHHAVIAGGSRMGMTKGLAVNYFSIQQFAENGTMSRPQGNIGYGIITRVYEDSSECSINLTRKGKSIDSIWINDLASVKLNFPVRPYSIFNEFACLGIYLKDKDRNFFYYLTDLLNQRTSKTDDSIKALMLDDLRKTYEAYKGSSGLSASLKEPLTGEGRYKGKIPFELCKTATIKDIEDFFLFIRTFPGGYMGQDLPFNQAFLSWVLTNSAYSPAEIHNGLYGIYKNPKAFAAALPKYRSSILSVKFITTYADSITQLNTLGRIKESDALFDFCLFLGNEVNDTSGKAELYLAHAQVMSDRRKYALAVTECDSARRYAVMAKNRKVEMRSGLKKSLAQFNLAEKDKGIATLKNMEGLLPSYRKALGEVDYYFYRQRIFNYQGYLHYLSGDYKEAVVNYSVAASINDTINTYESTVNSAEIYSYLGKVSREQGKNEDALQYYSRSSAIYADIRDTGNQAIIMNEKGAIYYDLSDYRKAVATLDTAYRILSAENKNDHAGYSISMMGNCFWQTGQIDSAITYHQRAIRLRKNINPAGVAFSYDQLGSLYQINGFKNKALDAYDSSRKIYADLQDSLNLADNYNNVGLVYHNDENYKKAISFYEQALGVSSKVSANALYNLGSAWMEIDKGKSMYYFQRCEKSSDSTKNLAMQFKALRMMTYLANGKSDFKAGDAYYNKAKSLLKEINSPQRIANLYDLRANRSFWKSDLDSALYYYQQSLLIYDSTSKNDLIWNMMSRADVLLTQGRFDESELWLLKAASLAESIHNPLAFGSALQSLSFLYAEKAEFERGLVANTRSAEQFRNSGNNIRVANAYNSRGLLYKGMGNYKEAIRYLFMSDSIYVSEGTSENRIATLNNIGVVYYSQSDYDKAIEYFRKAEQFFQPGLVTESFIINRSNLAECFYFQKRFAESEKLLLQYYPDAIKNSYIRIGTRMANVLGKLYFDQGIVEKSGTYFKQAYEYSKRSGSKEDLIDALVYLGKIDALGNNMAGAIKSISEARDIGVQTGMASKSWEPFYELGLLYYTQKRYDSAIANFRIAVDIIEKNTENIYGDEKARIIFKSDSRKVDLYSKIIASFAVIGDKKNVAEYSLRNSLAAVNAKYGSEVEVADPALKAELSHANEIKQESRALDESISKAKTEEKKQVLIERKRILEEGYQNFITELRKKYPDINKYFSGRVNPESFSDYKGELPEDVAVVSYIVNDNQLIMFIVTNEALEILTSPLEEDINILINQFISALSLPDSSSNTGSLKVRAEFADKKKNSAATIQAGFREII